MTAPRRRVTAGSTGLTLVEVMISLVVLAIGIMALARMFPAGARTQMGSRMRSMGCQYVNETFETLRNLPKNSALLSAGRHPASGYEQVGASGAWRRCYVVTQMPAPLDSLVKVDAVVLWTAAKPESVRITGYLLP